jgi:hypothetical protein
VLSWLTATREEEKCVNLLKEMELAQEEEKFFYMDPDESLEPMQQMTSINPLQQPQQNDAQQKKWGPIFNTRQSSRIMLKDKTPLY